MNLTELITIIKRLILVIFEKYSVLSEFDALGVDVRGLLGGKTT